MIRAEMKLLVLIIGLTISGINSSPKYDLGGFVPSSVDFWGNGKHQDQMAVPSQSQARAESRSDSGNVSRTLEDSKPVSERSQEPRFGFSNLETSGGGTGYGVSSYAPTKVDLGGLILGAVIGVGTILIIPKLLYIISGSYGAYARSDDVSFTNAMTKLDDILARHGIDTTSCMQRAVCTYAQKAAETVRTANDIDDDEKISSFDRMIETITTNQVFRTAMRGTAIQEAIEAGRKGQNCSRHYRLCGFSMESLLGLVSNMLSIVSSTEPHPTAPAAPL
ncbi:uncharacterized protein LOC107038463 [Diachasma alloeum]|uniref:uncharacterized protein LOC107038463 n=1 Tax=Diachasma alloeum TaxID=454923 RepID=UPI00073813DA|nr:uncharacterized protein LOC107038463 [Diachasma alloeum]